MSSIGDGHRVGWSRAFGLDELAFSCFKCLLLVPQLLVSGNPSLDSRHNSQGCFSLRDFVLNPPMAGCNANESDEEMTM